MTLPTVELLRAYLEAAGVFDLADSKVTRHLFGPVRDALLSAPRLIDPALVRKTINRAKSKRTDVLEAIRGITGSHSDTLP
ncbi:MAG TPA: hypothetical protein VFT74_14640 [Isosphaeraceae bacterium]|nr:hypothetical protein [Isosphaeraceae bacterium]